MTVLAWSRKTAQPAEGDPQTHALVIGVSHYAHLRGGSKHANQPCTENLGLLKQLQSPTMSAIEFAHFMRHEYNNPTRPLGSVDLLLSPQSAQAVSAAYSAVDRATFDNIRSAFSDWILRCAKNSQNVGVFYFCGHGLEKGEHILLPEDFGSSPNNAWDTSIAFDTTHAAMGANHFETQLYLVDACRELPVILALNHTVQPRALETLRNRPLHDRDAPILKATTKGGQAEALPGKVSYFTTAVLESFRKYGAERRSGANWMVTTSSLRRAVQMHMERFAHSRCDTGNGVSNFTRDLHEFSNPPQIFTEIRCRPAAAHPLAAFSLTHSTRTSPLSRPNPEADPWLLDVEYADWDVDATFKPSDSYQNVQALSQTSWPPLFTPKLETS